MRMWKERGNDEGSTKRELVTRPILLLRLVPHGSYFNIDYEGKRRGV